jgi:PAS domain S-box-containing protein
MMKLPDLPVRESILVVDDSSANLQLLTNLLTRRGYRVRFLPNAELALKSMESQLPDLILLDSNLPDADGYAMCQALKVDQQTRHIPVIFISTSEVSLDKVRAFTVGGVDFISKPFQAEEVLVRIETHLNNQRLQKQLIAQNIQLQQEIHQRKQAEKTLEQQLQKTLLLRQVIETIRSQADSQRLFEAIVEQIGQVFQVSRCSIHFYVPPPIPEIPLIAEFVNLGFASMRQFNFSLQDSLFIPEVLAHDRAIVSINVETDSRLQPIRSFCHLVQIKSILAVRTSYQNEANGVITLQQCDSHRSWAADEIILLEAIAAQLGIALAQVKSVEQERKQLEALGYQNLILRQEICQRRQVETALEESEAELRGLFTAMTDVVLVLDQQGRYLRMAPTNQKPLFNSASEVVGRTLHEVFPPHQADQFLSYIQSSLATQESVDCEYSLVVQAQVLWFSTTISPISEDTVLWVARDITARKLVETELVNKSTALRQFSNNLKQVHRLSLTDFETIEDLYADYLKTGCSLLGFTTGVVRQAEQQPYRVLATYSNLEASPLDLELFRHDIYCDVVLQQRQTICYEQGSQLPSTPTSLDQAAKIESYLGTPIWVDAKIFGTLCFFSTHPRVQGFLCHEPEIIELMAQSIGKFISTHRVKAKRQQAEEAVQLLLNLTQAITAAPDFNQALYAALQGLCEATGWLYGEVWLPAANGQALECSPVWYYNPVGQAATVTAAVQQLRQAISSVTFRPNEGIAGRVWCRQQPEWTPDFNSVNQLSFDCQDSQYYMQLALQCGIKARLGVPITIDRTGVDGVQAGYQPQVLAVLIFFTVEARQHDQRLIQLVSAVAMQLGTVLAQKQAEAELKALFAAMDDVVLVRDVSGRCLKVASTNPSFYKSAASILGKTLHETLPQPIADRMLAGIRTSLASGTTVSLEYDLPLPHQEVCLSVSISPLAEASVLIVARNISDRRQVEAALAKRERYLDTLVKVQRELLALQDQQTQYSLVLELLGQVTLASRVYLYENQRCAASTLVEERAEWCGTGFRSMMLPNDLYEAAGTRWATLLAEGEILSGTPSEFPASERALLESRGVLSILVLPLIVNGTFWGFVGFDDCVEARVWDGLEIGLLSTAAAAIALHYERKLAEDALRQSAEREQATLRVIEQMRQTLDIEQIFRTTVEELRLLLKCDRVLIYRFQPDWSGEIMAESVAVGWDSVMCTGTSSVSTSLNQADHCLSKTWISDLNCDTYLRETEGTAYGRGAKYLCVENVQQTHFSPCYMELLDRLQAQAYLIVPIFQGNRLWGLLASYQNVGPRDWQMAEINLVTHISTQLGVALQQADLLAQTQRQSIDLEKAKDAAEAADRAKTQFIATMSHELRTPLNSILGFTQLIGQDALLNLEHREYLTIINRSGQHLLELINDILEVAKLEANRASLQESEFDLYGLLDSIEAMLQLSAVKKQLQLNFLIAADVPHYIAADKGKLRQVLLNLLDNAIKFTQAGAVTLDVRRATALLEGKPRVLLQFLVLDTGFGIASEEMDLLFEAFVQTEAGRQSNQGTGLGLVISQQFVQLMGGKLQAQSSLGEGSIFEFTIPVRLADRLLIPDLEIEQPQGLNYGYDQADPSTHLTDSAPARSIVRLSSTDLEVMPKSWIVELYHAASGCSDRQVLQLIEQIPAVYRNLSEDLAELAYNFCFEEIVELTKAQI